MTPEGLNADYHATFGTNAGNNVLVDLMRCNFVFQPTVVPGDPHMTAFNEGRRMAVLGICRALNVTPDRVRQAMKDADVDPLENI